ncbi:FxsA family protein [Halapricum desulfuricans]|uniref:Protein affecting phage T7 exclusion by the F plasmid n=1 Tax=Halapricum desulfuricans TaxID=2841257 RepID=A0A897N4P8_9EURY|nr:FxsA family protein [Halapricum desulfuricans]QSG06049.1 Protein affecting phage T7 exclusion by the F plasmid [Halapricum desulfuricans]
MLRLIAVLLLIPLLDIMLLLAVAGVIGGLETVLLVVLTALVGMLLARAEGRHTISKIQRKLAQGEPPTDELVDGGLLIAAGAFLLTPGLVTDLVGLLLVVPLTRYPIRLALKKWVITPYVDSKTGGFATGEVYTVGFPGDGERIDFGGQGGDSDTYDVGDDDYDIGGNSTDDNR